MASSLLTHDRLRPYAGAMRIILIGYWLVLCVIMHLPRLVTTPSAFRRQDLVAHFIAYGLLATCVVLARKSRTPELSGRWKLTWLVILAAYAAVDELLQPLSGRDRDVTDWFADVLGIGLVLWLARSDRPAHVCEDHPSAAG